MRVHFVCVSDEESDDADPEGLRLPRRTGLHRATSRSPGEPTDLHIGVQAKGVLALRIEVRGTAAHGSTPWQGDNAVLKAVDVFRADRVAAVRARVVRAVRPPVDQPRPDHRRRRAQQGARPLRDRRRHPLPARPGRRTRSSPQIAAIPDTEVSIDLPPRPCRSCRGDNPYVQLLAEAIEEGTAGRAHLGRPRRRLRRHLFLEAGVPAVEFGPIGGGHHGPEEWVSIASLERYRKALVDFVDAGRRPAAPRRTAARCLRPSPTDPAGRSGSAS